MSLKKVVSDWAGLPRCLRLLPLYRNIHLLAIPHDTSRLRLKPDELADGLIVVLDGPLMLAQLVVGLPPVEVGRGLIWSQTDGLVQVLDSLLGLAQPNVDGTTAVVSYGSLVVQAKPK